VEEYDSSRFEKATPPVDQKPRLLIVDDDEDFLMVQRALLEEQGYEVVTARDGFDAMNKIPEVQPDLFVIDGMMPRMSGYQLTDLIRGTLETRDRPVIFASAKGSDRDRKMMAQKGVRQYLVKPFENSAMIAAVKEEVDRPGFRISTKRRTIKDILYDEGKRRAAHAATESKQKRWQTISTVEGFLKDNRRKGAFDKD
jgi:CheY-like chemotaxis protein